MSLKEAQSIRAKLSELDDLTNEVTSHLPNHEEWPELHDFLGKY